METGAKSIARERQRQVAKEGYTPDHDDEHDRGELARAAICYAAPKLIYQLHRHAEGYDFTDPWPWDAEYDKRGGDGNTLIPNENLSRRKRIDLLVKAGALIAAEIDRLRRIKD